MNQFTTRGPSSFTALLPGNQASLRMHLGCTQDSWSRFCSKVLGSELLQDISSSLGQHLKMKQIFALQTCGLDSALHRLRYHFTSTYALYLYIYIYSIQIDLASFNPSVHAHPNRGIPLYHPLLTVPEPVGQPYWPPCWQVFNFVFELRPKAPWKGQLDAAVISPRPKKLRTMGEIDGNCTHVILVKVQVGDIWKIHENFTKIGWLVQASLSDLRYITGWGQPHAKTPIFQKGQNAKVPYFFLFGCNCTKGRAPNILNNP